MADDDRTPPPNGYKTWGEFCASDPTNLICVNVDSNYEYKPSLAANSLFAALLGLSMLGFIVTYAVTRRGTAFTVAFVLGTLTEVIGYAGRIISHGNVWDQNGFLIQIICLTIAPAFLAAGIYLCLRRIVYVFGAENSRISPAMYTRFFIPCDVISLVLQAAGGALASIADNDQRDLLNAGNNIMIAGLSFQVFTLLVFIVVSVDFGLNVMRRHRKLGEASLDQSEMAVRLRGAWTFRAVLAALALATIAIFWRSVFRVAELSGGWDGPLMGREDLFIGFEGVMIVVACFALNVFHPSVFARDIMAPGFGNLTKTGAKPGHQKVESYDRAYLSPGSSDTEALPMGNVATQAPAGYASSHRA
ncbi:RTA1 like protein-domain-containing protein [Lasiosphaeria miniovina]|uniref:RTA1 like protein-domain-containing protein n=1 Tax=Lasiosphaeria miniovina TaxID=1954250 RepID=A0AA40DXC9_9PEZI|nr:RTA1 like protein-domain-containing protein [Lasiosphaeria miniovina]KAK0717127.1 RTA1 like protein-domain-containing protein [Lasiosphaeria miniovina]